MEEDHYSKEFDDAPMPHSIFFTKIGHAIHGTDSEGRLGTPASHGCVRLSRANASTLYALVRRGWRAQHHRDADRLVAGRAGAQSAARANTAVARRDSGRAIRAAIQCRRRSRRADTAAAGAAPSTRRKRRPTTATSIRPMAARTRRAIRRRAAAGASTTRRPISSRSRKPNITTTAATRPQQAPQDLRAAAVLPAARPVHLPGLALVFPEMARRCLMLSAM